MQGLLAKIYDMVISREPDSIVFGRRFNKEVSEIVKPLRQEMSDKKTMKLVTDYKKVQEYLVNGVTVFMVQMDGSVVEITKTESGRRYITMDEYKSLKTYEGICKL